MCPQTIWTFIFIWIEEKWEGAANKRKKLDQSTWSGNKLVRKAGKITSWVAFSMLSGLTFSPTLYLQKSYTLTFSPSMRPFGRCSLSSSFTGMTYLFAGVMRTIMCTHMCPYARFQSAMFDKDTYIVGYDTERGESRGPRSRKADPKELGLGDCIDCNLCVQVCPTGIDIRDGLQYECINCGACVDACDETMDKMGYARGLVSYTTEHELKGNKTHILRPRLIGYAAFMVIITVAFMYNISVRPLMELDVIRDRAQLFRINSEGLVENTYTLKLMNKNTSG